MVGLILLILVLGWCFTPAKKKRRKVNAFEEDYETKYYTSNEIDW